MGLKSFLKEQGFITDEPGEHDKDQGEHSTTGGQAAAPIAHTLFPGHPAPAAGAAASSDPSFVAPLPQNNAEKDQLDPTFIKFFEDELAKANLPGPDYYEFRQALIKTQQKMAATGVLAPEVVLQAVLMSFETQDVSRAKLKETALHYKEVLKQKIDDFLKGAAVEKTNQLQKRQTVLQAHTDAIKKMQQQLEQLEIQKQQIADAMAKEKNQLDVDKSLGKEGIEKIEKAERLITVAYNHIQSSIDADLGRL